MQLSLTIQNSLSYVEFCWNRIKVIKVESLPLSSSLNIQVFPIKWPIQYPRTRLSISYIVTAFIQRVCVYIRRILRNLRQRLTLCRYDGSHDISSSIVVSFFDNDIILQHQKQKGSHYCCFHHRLLLGLFWLIIKLWCGI